MELLHSTRELGKLLCLTHSYENWSACWGDYAYHTEAQHLTKLFSSSTSSSIYFLVDHHTLLLPLTNLVYQAIYVKPCRDVLFSCLANCEVTSWDKVPTGVIVRGNGTHRLQTKPVRPTGKHHICCSVLSWVCSMSSNARCKLFTACYVLPKHQDTHIFQMSSGEGQHLIEAIFITSIVLCPDSSLGQVNYLLRQNSYWCHCER